MSLRDIRITNDLEQQSAEMAEMRRKRPIVAAVLALPDDLILMIIQTILRHIGGSLCMWELAHNTDKIVKTLVGENTRLFTICKEELCKTIRWRPPHAFLRLYKTWEGTPVRHISVTWPHCVDKTWTLNLVKMACKLEELRTVAITMYQGCASWCGEALNDVLQGLQGSRSCKTVFIKVVGDHPSQKLVTLRVTEDNSDEEIHKAAYALEACF